MTTPTSPQNEGSEFYPQDTYVQGAYPQDTEQQFYPQDTYSQYVYPQDTYSQVTGNSSIHRATIHRMTIRKVSTHKATSNSTTRRRIIHSRVKRPVQVMANNRGRSRKKAALLDFPWVERF